jgi:hypothetical protein
MNKQSKAGGNKRPYGLSNCFGAALALAGLAGLPSDYAVAAPLSISDQKLVGDICYRNFQITPDDVRFEDCTIPLGRALADLRSAAGNAVAYSVARMDCDKLGLKEGTSDYALCVLERRDGGREAYSSSSNERK